MDKNKKIMMCNKLAAVIGKIDAKAAILRIEVCLFYQKRKIPSFIADSINMINSFRNT
jgi:hypothetical protein